MHMKIYRLREYIANRFLWRDVAPQNFVKRLNYLAKLKSRDISFFWDAESETFGVKQGDFPVIFVSRSTRIKTKYFGTQDRLKAIYRRYHLSEVEFSRNDIVVDVGANIGELSIALVRRYGVIPVCCEPDPIEIRALRKNLQDIESLIISEPLWRDKCVKEFYLNNDTGDSSLLPHEDTGPKVELTTTTLNDVGRQIEARYSGKRIRMLKLEAEGAEPEILEGGGEFLRQVDYIAADLGPERGKERANTVPACVNHLTDRGFRLQKVDPGRSIYLFSHR